MQRFLRPGLLALFLTMPVVAQAQAVTSVSLGDPAPPAWDASGHVAWLTVNKTGIAPDWNRWYDAATFGGSVGRFFGPHVKAEFDIATSASAEVYVERSVFVPGQTYPIYYSQPQRFRLTTLAGGLSYQFLDNRWFHPVVGAGVEAGRETRRIDTVVFGPQFPNPPLDPPGTTVTWGTRPFATVGFKWFVSERSFIRSDVRPTFDRDGVSHISWRSGFGFDF